MATAAASTLAGKCGLHAAVIPLLSLAIVQAAWIPVACAIRQHEAPAAPPGSWFAIGPPIEHSGVHTVPLGLAVIATGLAVHAGPIWFTAASVCLVLTWLTTVLYIGRFVVSVFRVKTVLRHLDGAWFLVPAALLGAAVATTTLSLHTGFSLQSSLMRLAIIAATAGLVGYWIVAAAAAVRILRHGLGDERTVMWWIGMGCAGLAAAAISSVLQAPPVGPAALDEALSTAMSTTLVVAVALLVPVLIGSVNFLGRRCHFRDKAAWPPTFSTAVFALGCLGTGTALHLEEVRAFGRYAAIATLVMWAVTALWNTSVVLRNYFACGARNRWL